MDEYEYRGYTIIENDNGYYVIEDIEFPSYDEACDWVDDQLYGMETPEPELHTYHIFYATADRGYDDYVSAYSKAEAERKLRKQYPDILYITENYPID